MMQIAAAERLIRPSCPSLDGDRMPRRGGGQGATGVPRGMLRRRRERRGALLDRIPIWGLALGAIVFAGQAIWAAFLENWVRVIFGAVIAVICLYGLYRRRSLL
jgi:hypothetical protein